MKIRQLDEFSAAPGAALSSSTNHLYPFLSQPFMHALEQSGSVSCDTGWSPKHLLLEQDHQPIAVLPLYEKNHSYGEYVFDWAWANAYQQHDCPYYPKLVTAIPFTPAQGPRMVTTEPDALPLWSEYLAYIEQYLVDQSFSSWHLLFPEPVLTQQLAQQHPQLILRSDCQFHWHNQEYRDFQDFLDRFASRKRKNVRKERKRISDQGLTLKQFVGQQITKETVDHFYLFYHSTYLKRGRQGYLNRTFFYQLLERLSEQMLLVMAYDSEQQPVAGSLFFFDDKTLYGRYWGSIGEFDSLHFEACYYQGIEFCIERGLQRFDPGTQGEHKIPRGFEPVMTHSLHRIIHPGFDDAIRRFVLQERRSIEVYMHQAAELLPFKQG